MNDQFCCHIKRAELQQLVRLSVLYHCVSFEVWIAQQLEREMLLMF